MGKKRQQKEETPQEKHVFREYYEAILVAVIFASFIKVFLFQTYKIPTPSMVPTIEVGDHLIVNKLDFREPGMGPLRYLFPADRTVERGEIVVFKGMEDPRVLLVKRVIGLPGDILAGSGTTLYRNGEPVEEPWARYAMEESAFRPAFGPVTVPEGHLFVMGDNRDLSLDSRAWGPLPLERVLGTTWFIYWSYEAPPYNPEESVVDKARNLAKVFATFLTKTRWERSFTVPK